MLYKNLHYSDVIMSAMTSQITGVSSVCSTICSSAYQRKHRISASLAFVRGNSPVTDGFPSLVTPKIFPFDDVIMGSHRWTIMSNCGVVAYYILVYVELKARIRKYWVNSFWPSDIIWRHRSLSALIHLMSWGWLIVNCNLLKEKQICEILM